MIYLKLICCKYFVFRVVILIKNSYYDCVCLCVKITEAVWQPYFLHTYWFFVYIRIFIENLTRCTHPYLVFIFIFFDSTHLDHLPSKISAHPDNFFFWDYPLCIVHPLHPFLCGHSLPCMHQEWRWKWTEQFIYCFYCSWRGLDTLWLLLLLGPQNLSQITILHLLTHILRC